MLGTIAYAALATIVLGLALFWLSRRRLSAWLAWPLGLAFCWAVELWQLTGVPARLSAQWIGWRLTLGTSFDWVDIALYPAGVALGACALAVVRRLRAPASAEGTELVRKLWAGTAVLGFWGALVPLQFWLQQYWAMWWSGDAPVVPATELSAEGNHAQDSLKTLWHTAQAVCGLLQLVILLSVVGWFLTRLRTAQPVTRRQIRALSVVGTIAPIAAVGVMYASSSGDWGLSLLTFGAVAHALVVARIRGGSQPHRGAWGRAVGMLALNMLAVALTILALLLVVVLVGNLRGDTFSDSASRSFLANVLVVVVVGGLSGWGLTWLARPTMADDTPEAESEPVGPPAPSAARRASTATAVMAALLLPLAVTVLLLSVHGSATAVHQRQVAELQDAAFRHGRLSPAPDPR